MSYSRAMTLRFSALRTSLLLAGDPLPHRKECELKQAYRYFGKAANVP